MSWNVEAAVGVPMTASATVKTLTTDTAAHATLTAGRWYELSCTIALAVETSTDDTSATTNSGALIPANTVYAFYLPPTYTYVSVLNVVADEGAVNAHITPKRAGN
jgi:hypothetical protein